MDGNYNKGNYNNGNYNNGNYNNNNGNNKNENDKGRFYCRIGWFAVGALSMVTLGSAITLIQGIFSMSYLHNYSSGFQSESTQQDVKAEDVLKVSNLHWEAADYGNYYVAGILSNDSDKEFSYVEIDLNIYDKNGVQIDSVYANTLNLEPHGKWEFKAIVSDPDAYYVKTIKIIGH